jgi:hypothetical protein
MSEYGVFQEIGDIWMGASAVLSYLVIVAALLIREVLQGRRIKMNK